MQQKQQQSKKHSSEAIETEAMTQPQQQLPAPEEEPKRIKPKKFLIVCLNNTV